MADRKATVVNPAGYQEQLPDTDNLVLAAAPSSDNHGANKKYVDDGDTALQGQIDAITGGSLDGKYVERAGDDMTGNLTFDTDKIELNVDGSATFAGDIEVNGVDVGRGSGGVSSNTAVGTSALFTNTTGSANTGVGLNALYYVTTGSNNTGVGNKTLQQTTGDNNTAVGSNALYTNNAGSDNTAVGYLSLYYNQSGNNNTAIGRYSLVDVTTGNNNIGIGYTAGDDITTGSNNTIIGDIPGTADLNDTVIIAAGSTERLRIDSAGSATFNNTIYLNSNGSIVTSGATDSSYILQGKKGNDKNIELFADGSATFAGALEAESIDCGTY